MDVAVTATTAPVGLRPPEHVMRLARMGSFHQSRLSFMRILLRRMKHEEWQFDRSRFDVDGDGIGAALYTATTPNRTYTLVAFAHDLADDERSDRVIATAWDATFALFDGVPTEADVDRLRANVPLQEAGRVSERELTLSRANRSVRLWNHVVESLAAGHQPSRELVDSVGYLMRTTAVYGSGKFGAADREVIEHRSEFTAPFQVEMLTVFLIRAFVVDLVEHLASCRSDEAVALDPAIRRSLGIGNSTGLGMAPFLLTHPLLINNWIHARETALARVRSVEWASAHEVSMFMNLVARSGLLVQQWNSDHPLQRIKIAELSQDLTRLEAHLATVDLIDSYAWDAVIRWGAESMSLEGQELIVSLVLEPYGHLVDDLAMQMHADEATARRVDGSMPIGTLRRHLDELYAWAEDIDWSSPDADARAWYVSAEKLEPRLGERHHEPVAEYEQPLQPGRDARRLAAVLFDWPDDAVVAEMLAACPEHRHTVRRTQIAARAPYAEIRDNTIAAEMLPIDLLRAKLSFFGATHFDPRSDRWVRITMYRGAPLPQEVVALDADDWTYPLLNG